MEKIFQALASALNLDVEEFTAALRDGDKWLTDEQLADKIGEAARAQVKAAKEAQLKRGKRETMLQVERWMKAQGFENPDKLQGDELLEAYAEHWKAQAPAGDPSADGGKKPGEMSREDLAKLPAVKELMAEAVKGAASKYDAVKAEFEAYQKKTTVERIASVAKQTAAQILEENRAILEVPGSDITKAQRLDAFYRFLNFEGMQIDEKGAVVLLDPNGDPLVNDMGKPVSFKDKVLEINKSLYGFHTQDPNKGGANPPANGGQKPGEWKPSITFADQAAYDNFYRSETDAKKRAEGAKSWAYQLQQSEAADK
jgi:hypothetical protein